MGFAGAAPAAPQGVAVANQMTFQDSTGRGSNDRLLLFSMLGVVGMTLLAFLFSYMNRPAASTVPPPAPVVVEQAPRPNGGPGAEPVQTQALPPQPDPAPVQQVAEMPPPTYIPAPAVQPTLQPNPGQRFGGNRKLGIAMEGTSPQ